MKTRKTLAAALVMLGAAVALSACGKSEAGNADAKKNGAQAVSVKTETIQPGAFTEIVQVTGSLAAFDDITVPAEEGGRLMKWDVPRGGRVSKGQVIAHIDDALLKSGYEAANAQYQIAELNATRQQKVYKEQGISEVQIKSIEYQRDAAKAQADLAKTRFEKCSIKSPVAGVLETQFIDAGEMVGPGMPVARVVDNSRLKILAGVPERYAGWFKLGDPVTFTIDAFPGQTFNAKITFVGAAVSRDNRSIPIEATVTTGIGRLKPDMIAAMTIMLAARQGVIVVKEDYVQQVDKDRFVVFVENNGVAEERRVSIGASSEGRMLITGGLAAGDRLITLGYQNVANGQKIAVHN